MIGKLGLGIVCLSLLAVPAYAADKDKDGKDALSVDERNQSAATTSRLKFSVKVSAGKG